MTVTVTFDRSKCQGYANCLIEAPEIWDFDEDTDTAVLLSPEVGEDLRAKAEASARGCPAHAIEVAERDPAEGGATG